MFTKLQKATIRIILSVRPHAHETAWLQLGRYSWNLILEYFWKICQENSNFIKIDKNNGYVKTIIHLWYLFLRLRNVSDKVSRENQKHISGSITFLKNCADCCEIMWKNIVQPDRSQMTVRRMCIACWIPKSTKTHSEYVILFACPLQQWSHGDTSVHYAYIAMHIVFMLFA